jgi:hypothetical protein
MENLEHLGKSKNLAHTNLIGYENILFGSWGIIKENHGEEHLSDFLPNLSKIKNLKPPHLNPLSGLGDEPVEENSISGEAISFSRENRLQECL